MKRVTKISLVFFLTIIFFQLSAEIVPAQITSCAVTKVGNPAGQPVIPPECQTNISGDAKVLAQQILVNSNIHLSPEARGDLQAVVDGKMINNTSSCGNSVTVHPALLKVILQLGQKHAYDVWNIITGHACDRFYHPKGRAMDIGNADGEHSWQNAAFRQDAADVLPDGATLLQTGCPGTPPVIPRRRLIQGDDFCTHQHIDVGIAIP